MGHHIHAFVRAESVLRSAFDTCAPIGGGLVLVPVDEQLADTLAGGPDSELRRFCRLTPRGLATARARIGESPFGYIETDYFGGSGGQLGAAWHGATELVAPRQHDDIVNDVLRALGVMARPGLDEWDTVGLTRFRSNDAIRAAARPAL